MKKLNLTEEQKKAFNALWSIYGNGGAKCTLFNHKLVQGFVEWQENRIDAYKEGRKNFIERFGEEKAKEINVTDECIDECLKILNNER